MKIWQIAPKCSDDLTEQLLFNRGIKNETEREKFFHPKLTDFEKELQIPGIARAKKRIEQAIKNNELIVVFGDYDVDGLCGTAILYLGLTMIGAKVLPYIPHRDKEGYGLNKLGLNFAKEQGAGLVITVDNGITAIEEAVYAQKLGLDLIITDHHLPSDQKQDVLSVIHSTEICGAAVGWSLVKALISQEKAAGLLDLVAMATVSDMVPLIGVNRALAKIGLEKLNQTEKTGLLALMKQSGLKPGEIDAYQIGHILGPRLNAKGRLEHAMDALRLLCTKDIIKASRLAGELNDSNEQKKQLITKSIIQARQLIGETDKKIMVLSSTEWIPGLTGLIAGRIAEEYCVPTVVISQGEEVSKGSARSNNGINIIETIRQLSDLLIDIGGHPQAAGFTIATSKIEIFRVKLEEASARLKIDKTEKLAIDAKIKPQQVTKKLIKKLAEFEPTGVGNPKPLLASDNLKITNIKTVGNGQHLKFLADNVSAIAFGFGKLFGLLENGQFVNLAYYPEIDTYGGIERLQFKVLDIQLP